MSVLINEEVAAQLALKDLLEADSTLMGLVNGVALRSISTSVPVPFVKIDRQDSSDLMVINMNRVWSELTYLVRGITAGPDWTLAQQIANRIDQVLHRATTTNATVTITEIHRMEPFTDETLEQNQLYLHAGGIYTLHVQAV